MMSQMKYNITYQQNTFACQVKFLRRCRLKQLCQLCTSKMLVKQSVEATVTVSWRVHAVIRFLQVVLSFARCFQESTKMFFCFRFLFTSKCSEGVLVRSGQLIHLSDLSVYCNFSLPTNLHVFAISLWKKKRNAD